MAAHCQRMGWDISAAVIDRIEARVRGVYDHELVNLSTVLGVSLDDLVQNREAARIETDRDGLVTRVNEEFTRLCGHTLAELRGKRRVRSCKAHLPIGARPASCERPSRRNAPEKPRL